jgi:hypothetical protein
LRHFTSTVPGTFGFSGRKRPRCPKKITVHGGYYFKYSWQETLIATKHICWCNGAVVFLIKIGLKSPQLEIDQDMLL